MSVPIEFIANKSGMIEMAIVIMRYSSKWVVIIFHQFYIIEGKQMHPVWTSALTWLAIYFSMFKRTMHWIYSLQYCSKWSHYAINASDINSFFDDWINSTFNIPQSSITAACLAMERNSSVVYFRWHWKLMLFAQYPYIIQTLQLKMN